MLKRQPTDTQFLFITLMLVLLMGIPTFNTLMSADPEFSEDHVVVAASSMPRVPASIPTTTSMAAPSALSHFAQFDFKCTKKSAGPLKVDGRFIQLQGKNCLKNYQEGDVEIVNKSNGYTASIFDKDSDKYQTDLIQLQKGDNEIVIRYRDRSGKTVEEALFVHSIQI